MTPFRRRYGERCHGMAMSAARYHGRVLAYLRPFNTVKPAALIGRLI